MATLKSSLFGVLLLALSVGLSLGLILLVAQIAVWTAPKPDNTLIYTQFLLEKARR